MIHTRVLPLSTVEGQEMIHTRILPLSTGGFLGRVVLLRRLFCKWWDV